MIRKIPSDQRSEKGLLRDDKTFTEKCEPIETDRRYSRVSQNVPRRPSILFYGWEYVHDSPKSAYGNAIRGNLFEKRTLQIKSFTSLVANSLPRIGLFHWSIFVAESLYFPLNVAERGITGVRGNNDVPRSGGAFQRRHWE